MIMRRLSRLVLASTIAAITATGCQDAQGPGAGGQDTTQTPPPILVTLIVSNPTLSALADPAASLNGSAAPGDVYVSLPPGSFPGGDSMVVRTRRTGLRTKAALVNGGIDPVPVVAEAGDTLDVLVYLDNQDVRQFISLVPLRRPPVIVRTDPPPAKRDVPLNAVLILVFSEPIKPSTLTAASVQLSLNGVPVPGALAFADSTQLTVTFTPGQPLTPGATYSLQLTQAIEDLSGDALAAPVTVGFVTQTALPSVDGAYERVTPHSLPGYHSRYVLRGDGSFELQYETVAWGNFAYTGRYWRTSVGIIFHFDSSNTAGAWTATAQLSGDSLAVAHNIVMQLADFEDGLYVQPPDTTEMLAFVRDSQIHRINADGTGLVQLTTGPGDADPAWSPDGRRIAFSRRTGQDQFGREIRDIYIMDADGSNVAQRTSGGYNEAPAWSPDGMQIAFAALGGGSLNVYVMPAVDDGAGATSVVSRPGWDGQPAWSPDGSGIAFASDWTAYDFTMDIYVTSPDGAQISQATDGFGFDGSLVQYYQPAWSPDGRRLATVTCLIAFNTCGASTISVMNANGSNLVQLAATAGMGRPTWSPDGQKIAFASSGSIHWVSADGSAQGIIVANGHSPAWRR
jgi:hypothetical protein